jgi:DNA (cytosine-5)-methyltransferase 1
MGLRFISLFAGIGGFDLGLERAGMTCVAQVEIDEWCRKVLAKHWPGVPRYTDICTIAGNDLPPCDVLCGGFPCQPHSLAGKREAATDERELWGEFRRLIGEIRPRWIVAENVPGLLSTHDRRFFGGILRDLAAFGYDATWSIVSACAVGAPHSRERVFILAHCHSDRGYWGGEVP